MNEEGKMIEEGDLLFKKKIKRYFRVLAVEDGMVEFKDLHLGKVYFEPFDKLKSDKDLKIYREVREMTEEEKIIEEILAKYKDEPPTEFGKLLIWLNGKVDDEMFRQIRNRFGILLGKERETAKRETAKEILDSLKVFSGLRVVSEQYLTNQAKTDSFTVDELVEQLRQKYLE